jgi:hypothetical protein
MSNVIRITESGVLKTGDGQIKGIVVNSHTSGTLKIINGTSEATAALGTFTSTGALAAGSHANTEIASTGASVAATHANGTLTVSGGTNFKDAVKASAVLTSDQTNVTANDTVTIGAVVYTFKATPAAAYEVKVGSSAAISMENLFKAITDTGNGSNYFDAIVPQPDVDAVLTSTYVITVTAKTAGTAGNSIAATETSTHLDWDGSNTTLTGGLAAETVTIGTTVYTFKDTLTGAANEVKIAATSVLTLVNLKKAINASGVAGVDYGFGTVAHTQVVAYTTDATTAVIKARVVGDSLNALATTETCAAAAWGGTTLVDGVATTSSTVTIGTTVYTQVDVLTETYGAAAVANQFLRGASEATMLDALKAAVNGTSVGTLCSTGTVAHPDVIATTNADAAQTFVARVPGVAANDIATTTTLGNKAFPDTTLGGGTGASTPGIDTATATVTIGDITYTFVTELSETSGAAAIPYQVYYVTSVAVALDNLKSAINGTGTVGTTYSTGTVAHPLVKATTNANDSQVIEARTAGVQGNLIATTDEIDNHAWGATTMASGVGTNVKIMNSTITLAAVTTVGDRFIPFFDAEFTNGLYITIGGVADVTVMID